MIKKTETVFTLDLADTFMHLQLSAMTVAREVGYSGFAEKKSEDQNL